MDYGRGWIMVFGKAQPLQRCRYFDEVVMVLLGWGLSSRE
jgi:hypothetical protein